MRGFTEFAGRLTRLVYSRERGIFVAETVPHAFEALSVAEASPTAPPPDVPASAACSDTAHYSFDGEQNDR
jgi:hypothetical protein